jgi:hypothetical protein
MKYTDFIELPPIKNQKIYVSNVLDIQNVKNETKLKELYLKARLSSYKMQYYCIYTTIGFYSGYSGTCRCIVKAQFFDEAVRIAKAMNLIEKDASVDRDFADGDNSKLPKNVSVPVIELEF